MHEPRNFARSSGAPGSLGVYVHFPYCLAKCPYCDFTSFASDPADIPHEAYADAVLAELEIRAQREVPAGVAVQTIFFGGGTPSLWDARALGRVLAGVRARLPVADDAEVTAECNPSSLDPPRARALVSAGVNRLSVGVQSLDKRRLQFLGRLHDPSGALGSLEAALASGAARVSADLIFGVEGGAPQRPEDAAAEADRVAATGVGHVSAYGLTIEPGTAFGERHRAGALPVATDETIMEAADAVESALAARGFARYEVSNHAKPGQEARHNLGYWLGHDYLGLGCGAVGALRGAGAAARRYRNAKDPRKYMRLALEGAAPEVESEHLDAETRMRERIMLGLRLTAGVDLEQAASGLGVDPLPADRERALRRLLARHAVVVEGARVRIAESARHLTDGIAAELF